MNECSSAKPLYLPTYQGCMVCGYKGVNPNTLQLRFQITQDGVKTTFTPRPEQEGYPGIVHGGIITAVLDETIGWAVAVARKKYFVTGELTIRFLKPLPIGKEVIVVGHALEHKTRYSEGKGEIIDQNGLRYAWAKGKFFLLSEEKSKEIDAHLSYHEGDVHLLDEET